MPHLPFIKSVIPCISPQVVGHVWQPLVTEHLLSLVSLQISLAKSGHGKELLPSLLPSLLLEVITPAERSELHTWLGCSPVPQRGTLHQPGCLTLQSACMFNPSSASISDPLSLHQPLCPSLHQPLCQTLYQPLCPAAGRAKGCTGGSEKDPPGTATIPAQVHVLGRVINCAKAR